ncbi:MAG: carotenoid biosynthesis protein [Bacteroidales bacterium]
MEKMIRLLRSRNLVPLLILYFAVGVAGMIYPATRSLFQSLTPFSLLACLVLLLIYHRHHTVRFWVLAFFILMAGIAVEIAGVSTGVLFGAYTYGDTLGPKVFHTPLMIGINWLLLVYCSHVIADRFVEDSLFKAITGAALMVVYDFALEPSAIALDMWHWDKGAVPLQNYVAWFVIAFLFHLLAGKYRLVDRENKLALPLFFIQMGFFIALDIWIISQSLWDFSLHF